VKASVYLEFQRCHVLDDGGGAVIAVQLPRWLLRIRLRHRCAIRGISAGSTRSDRLRLQTVLGSSQSHHLLGFG
jgi:hypothetical protein